MADNSADMIAGSDRPSLGNSQLDGSGQGLIRRISENWLFKTLWQFWRAMWVTRAATISVLVGFALLWNVSQVQDLFAEIKGDPLIAVPFWVAFYACVILAWAFPVFLSARLSIDYYRELIDPAAFGAFWPKVYPSILVALIFVATTFSTVFALSNLHLTGMTDQTQSQFSTYFRELQTLGTDVTRTIVIDSLSTRHLLVLPIVTVIVGVITIYVVSRVDTKCEINIFTGVFVIIISVLAVAMIALDPLDTAVIFPRIIMLPIILGTWVPLLSYIAHWSHRLHAPLILCLAALAGLYGLLAGDNHDIRGIAVSQRPLRADLDTELCRWAKANSCSIRRIRCNIEQSTQCPSPIIVVAEGGASRAAFYTGTVLGHFLDLTRNGPNASLYRDFNKQVFAISAVSGGALGAGIYSAAVEQSEAIAKSQNPKQAGSDSAAEIFTKPPCRADANKDLWFGAITLPERAPKKFTESWRSCIQLTLSADFLTPTMASLGFHDLIGFPWRGDRAVTLERAWTKSLKEVTGSGMLEEAFFSKNRSETQENWHPLVIYNGSSVETGRRIIVTRLHPNLCKTAEQSDKIASADCTRIFKDSYDFEEVLTDARPAEGFWTKHSTTWPCTCPEGQRKCLCDISNGTAIAVSARFPIISPHGNIRNSTGQIVDRVVDGGYFEGFGALTALELAEAVARRGLRPFVLLISNSPDLPDLPCVTDRDPETACHVPSIRARQKNLFVGPCPPDADDLQWLSSIRAPFGGLFSSRIARATHASVQLCNWARQHNERRFEFARRFGWTNIWPRDNFALVRVWPQENSYGDTKTLSMSWWLSKPVQAYLNAQIETAQNKPAIDKVLCVLSKDLASSPNCSQIDVPTVQ